MLKDGHDPESLSRKLSRTILSSTFGRFFMEIMEIVLLAALMYALVGWMGKVIVFLVFILKCIIEGS